MLEFESGLRTWRLNAPPVACQIVLAEPIGVHRPIYLDYEGPVSGGRGTVRRWDAGTYHDLTERDGLAEFGLRGTKVRGHCSIRRDGDAWKLTFTAD
jgi:hypothetical protein